MNFINYKTKYQDKEIQDFIECFLTSAYVNNGYRRWGSFW